MKGNGGKMKGNVWRHSLFDILYKEIWTKLRSVSRLIERNNILPHITEIISACNGRTLKE